MLAQTLALAKYVIFSKDKLLNTSMKNEAFYPTDSKDYKSELVLYNRSCL